MSADDRPGKVDPSADITGAESFNYLWHSATWLDLSPAERVKIESVLPIKRVGMAAPTDGSGYWSLDKSYSSGGVSLERRTFRPI